MKNFNYIVFAAFIILMLIPSVDLFAVCTFPGGCCPDQLGQGHPACTDCPPCVPVPLDGGLSALLLAGVAYGAKKVYGKVK
ncbi:MAG: PID-CTERM protein-sorting domain-containing protein [Vicingaceae bacterium]